MVQTRSAANRVQSKDDAPVEHLSASLFPSPVKKGRGDDMTALKKRRRGKAGEISQLNLDILFLIARYVQPVDLLSLARTCKSLRRLLMDKSSVFVWKTARCQVNGLPGCPADLAEPEYANLVFCARCHDCGKHAKTVLWEIRRRYCLNCRVERLFPLSSCHEVIRRNSILPMERMTIEGETTIWVDREQMVSFMAEYKRSSDKKQFLKDKEEEHVATCMHARQCEKWQGDKAIERRADLKARRRDRDNSIFERLKQLGYEAEVAYFSPREIQFGCKALFGKSKPLTDKEWNRIWPGCAQAMNDFRSRRLEELARKARARRRPFVCTKGSRLHHKT